MFYDFMSRRRHSRCGGTVGDKTGIDCLQGLDSSPLVSAFTSFPYEARKVRTAESARNDQAPTTPTAANCDLVSDCTLYENFPIDLLLDDANAESTESAGIFALENAIHPIFGKEMFDDDVRYDALVPSLQLATLLLQSPASEEYLYALLLSRPVDVPYGGQSNVSTSSPGSSRTYKSIFRKGGMLTPKESARLRRIILKMVPFIEYPEHDDIQNNDHGIRAKTEPCDWIPIEGIHDGSGRCWDGVASDILLNKGMLESFYSLYDSSLSGSEYVEKLSLQRSAMDIAITLVHELCHAFSCARFGPDLTVGFEHQPVAEDGYVWEFSVFGGVMNNHSELAEMAEYPCVSDFDGYMRDHMGDGYFVASPPTNEVDLWWVVPDSFIISLFQSSHWTRAVPAQGLDVLKVPRLLGYRRLPSAARGACKCLQCQSDAVVVDSRMRCSNGPFDWDACRNRIDAINKRLTLGVEQDGQAYADQACDRTGTVASASASDAVLPSQNYSTQLCKASWSQHGQAEEESEHCERSKWESWPFGPSSCRLHGASRDPTTYGVPEGFVSLLDGTIVPLHHADMLRAREQREMAEDCTRAETLLLELKAEEDENSFAKRSTEEKLRLRQVIKILSEMLASDDPAVRRMVGGVQEVAELSPGYDDDDEVSDCDESDWESIDESDEDDAQLMVDH